MSNTCKNCAHWTPHQAAYPTPDGTCRGVGASFYRESKTIVLAGNILPGSPHAPELVTDEEFGCVRFEARP